MQGFCEKLDKIFEQQLSNKLAFNVVNLFYEYLNKFDWDHYFPNNEDLHKEFPCSTYEENGVYLKHKHWDRYDKMYITYESGITIIIEQTHGATSFKIKNNGTTIAKTEVYESDAIKGPYLHELIIPRVKSA